MSVSPLCLRALSVALGTVLTATFASAGWEVTDLSPDSRSHVIQGGYGGQQVGFVALTDGHNTHASLWSGTAASWVDIHPTGYASSQAFGIYGGQQVGYASGHAGLWSGTSASFVDLNPAGYNSSYATGIYGGQQVGAANVGPIWSSNGDHAGLWTGTASSFVDLNPDGFRNSGASAVYDGVQVGSGTNSNFEAHALLWHGTAASVVDLGPGRALGVYGLEQVGYANGEKAALWSGTAASLVSLHPEGFSFSVANAVCNGLQVGTAFGGTMLSNHAALWSGSAGSYIDINPSGYFSSSATAIWSDGKTTYIAGYGTASPSSSDYHALLWTQTEAVPEPVTVFLGASGLALAIARRRNRSAA